MLTREEQIRLENIADTDHEIFALLKQRYSPRTFKNKRIPAQQQKQLFEAARWAASSGNSQPWKFLYTEKSTDAFDQIYYCLDKAIQKWAHNAQILILTACKSEQQGNPDLVKEAYDLGLSLGSMTIQAQYMGIALHHIFDFDEEKIEGVFSTPEDYHLVSVVAVGYYGGELEALPEDLQQKEVAPRTRYPQSQFVFRDNWHN